MWSLLCSLSKRDMMLSFLSGESVSGNTYCNSYHGEAQSRTLYLVYWFSDSTVKKVFNYVWKSLSSERVSMHWRHSGDIFHFNVSFFYRKLEPFEVDRIPKFIRRLSRKRSKFNSLTNAHIYQKRYFRKENAQIGLLRFRAACKETLCHFLFVYLSSFCHDAGTIDLKNCYYHYSYQQSVSI